jgi:phosphoribosyl-ATP pyrophosphohydrolase
MTGEAIEAMLAKAYGAPKAVVARAADLVYPAVAKLQ